ncbi:hypothetical protein HBH98_042480 [Parastagonospora nodorum]|nr:hypothetical protein HBH51_082020 [Parastagonospora nodorum]KAH4108899.1 hypothetical protein HBH46_035460 [Parastagonospora nodorum]KAH4131003.1 hypothetical protein HBH47_017870 [Parastagonospora nodorum]KAH4194989.1 hypothetical protein HBH42_087600 [Parastagonospora nodorum]KAH4232125.1 hypothetical protein HBI06_076910 [Parastagonospora nodorum]
MLNISAWVLATLAVVQLAHAAPQGISRSARCGPSFGLTCKGSSFGNCCSKYGYCGSTINHCDSKTGCQASWGSCSSASSPAATSKISKNGKCSGDSGATCQGSTYGNCCSQYGYCGSTTAYCGKNCNPLFGACSSSPSSALAVSLSPSAVPSPALVVSTNARCGSVNGALPKSMTCRGSKFGSCCSQHGYCGTSKDYCNNGCQSFFGDCNAMSSSSPSKLSTQPGVSSTTTLAVAIVTSSTTIVTSLSSTPSAAVTAVNQISSLATVSSASVLSPPSTSTTALSTTTPASPSSPAAPSETLKCKEIGRLRDTEFLANIGFTRQVILEQCTATCLAAPACTYFIFRNGADCLLFGGNVATSGPVVPSPDYNLYERGCFATMVSSSTYLSPTSVISTTSSSSSGSPSASPTPAVSAPLCDVRGSPEHAQNMFIGAYRDDEVGTCSSRCFRSSECTYFILQSGSCSLYKGVLAEGGLIIPNNYNRLYEKTCFQTVASSSSAFYSSTQVTTGSTSSVTPTSSTPTETTTSTTP